MTKRERHNIESNCVTFNDDCFDETVSHVEHVITEQKEVKQSLTGDGFVKYLEKKLAVRNG